jgi:hypothetical protein
MEEQKSLPTLMECAASYSLRENDGREIAQGASELLLDVEKLTVLPISGEPLLVPYRDIVHLAKVNYKIEASLVSKEMLVLSNLGYKYEDFFKYFSNLNNELTLKDFLMNETLKRSGLEAEFQYTDEHDAEKAPARCELRIYETGLVIISEEGSFIRIPYGDVAQMRIENYKLVLDTDYDESYSFSKMGKELDSFFKMLNDLMNALSTKTQMSLKELLPAFDSSITRKIARLMKEGRAVRRVDVDAISPGIWVELEKKLELFGIKEEYEYLRSISQAEKMCIGIKRGLLGDLTAEYIWFLAPISNLTPDQLTQVIAMEATSAEGAGRATYFFEIGDQDSYSNPKKPELLQAEVDKALKNINRNLVAVNFRREPIYLTDEQLNSAEYAGYRRAIAKIPALKELRRLFIGRVMHHSPAQWKTAVNQLLETNANRN